MKIKTLKILKTFVFVLAIVLYSNTNISAQAVSINSVSSSPDASAMLDITSTSSGILIPRMTEAQRGGIDLTGTPTGVLIYQTDGAVPGFYYYNGTDWQNLFGGSVPVVPGESEYWLRPTADPTYIYPEGNNMIKVYDSGETYGLYYDGGTNQYGVYARTTDITDPTAAVVGFSDVSGNRTYGYLGYNGTYSFDGGTQTIEGSSVYGMAEDADRTAGFFRSTDAASVAANINYSDVWMASYNFVENSSASYNPSSVYAQLNNTDATLGGDQYSILGLSVYEGASDGAGTTMGGYFQGWGSNTAGTAGQVAVGVTGDAYGTSSGNYDAATGVKGGSNAGTIYAHPNGYGAGVEGTGLGGGAYFDLVYDASAGSGYYWGDTWNGLIADAWPAIGANGDGYFFGVHGSLYDLDANNRQNQRSGGVLGSFEDGGTHSAWGSLGYHASDRNYYGVYGSTAYASGGGKNNTFAGTGVAGNGSLFGSWFKGEVYGMAVQGDRYGLYVSGKQYTNEVITQLSDNGASERTATYVPTSMTVDIYMKGTGTLVNGKAAISFDKKYQNLISDKEPIIVTVTPMGQTNGVYLESVKSKGFSIAENNAGKSNTTFTWIAVATKKGYENPKNPNEVMAKDYDSRLEGHMMNESILDNQGTPMWFDGNEIKYTEREDSNKKTNIKERKVIVEPKMNIDRKIDNKNNLNSKQSFKKIKVVK